MIKFSNALLFIVPSLLVLACGAPHGKKTNNAQSALSEVVSADSESSIEIELGDSEAASSLYLDDMVDSGTTAVDEKDTETDSVKEDLKPTNVQTAAQRLLDQLDADDSNTLTKEEFLAILTTVGGKSEDLSAEKLAEVKAKFEKSFDGAKGDDEVLSLEEIQTLVKSHGKRVCKFRDNQSKRSRAERIKTVSAAILEKFDANDNGKLDAEEQKAMREEMKKECRSGRGKSKGKHKGHGKDGAEAECKVVGKTLTKGTAECEVTPPATTPEKPVDVPVIVIPTPAEGAVIVPPPTTKN